MKVTRYSLSFDTSYNQFYIADKASIKDTSSSGFWTEEAFESRLAVEEQILGVGTECYGPVKATLTILTEQSNNSDLEDYDHVVEASIAISSGILQILDCPNLAVELEVNIKPGPYRVRVYSSNLSSVDGDECDDFYQIEIWPNEQKRRSVLKKYSA